MQGGKAALSVVTSRQGWPAGLGGPSVPHLPTGHLISHEPRPEPLVQAGVSQPSSFSPALRVLGPWEQSYGCSVRQLPPHLHPHFLMVGLANEAPGPAESKKTVQGQFFRDSCSICSEIMPPPHTWIRSWISATTSSPSPTGASSTSSCSGSWFRGW